MMYHGLSPRVCAASTYSRVLMSSVRLRTMRKMPGPEASATAMKMLSVLGLTLQDAERIGVEDEGGEEPGADQQPSARAGSASCGGCVL